MTQKQERLIYSDKQVLEAILVGKDEKVFKFLYKEVFPKIKKFIRKNSGTEDDAKDLFQDAVIALYKYVKLGKFNENYSIAGFIYSVCRNRWINVVKQSNTMIELTEETPLTNCNVSAVDQIISREREQYVMDVFAQLGDKCKEVLIYSIYQKLSMKEIKEKMGFTSEDVAKTKNYKCKQRLIDLVKDNPSIKSILQG